VLVLSLVKWELDGFRDCWLLCRRRHISVNRVFLLFIHMRLVILVVLLFPAASHLLYEHNQHDYNCQQNNCCANNHEHYINYASLNLFSFFLRLLFSVIKELF
jgi:hypothetical protein